jgi:hypothetical protein
MKFSPPSGTIAPRPTFGGPISSPVQTTVPDRRPPLPGARHCRPDPHSARTSNPPPPPSLARLGQLPHLPLPFFSSPLLGKETDAPPHGAPIADRAVAASSSISHCQHRSRAQPSSRGWPFLLMRPHSLFIFLSGWPFFLMRPHSLFIFLSVLVLRPWP